MHLVTLLDIRKNWSLKMFVFCKGLPFIHLQLRPWMSCYALAWRGELEADANVNSSHCLLRPTVKTVDASSMPFWPRSNTPTATMRLLNLTRKVLSKPCVIGVWAGSTHPCRCRLVAVGVFLPFYSLVLLWPPPQTSTRSVYQQENSWMISSSFLHLKELLPPPLAASVALLSSPLVRTIGK